VKIGISASPPTVLTRVARQSGRAVSGIPVLLVVATAMSGTARAQDPFNATVLSNVAERVTPAVVNITTRRNPDPAENPMFREFLERGNRRQLPLEAAGSGVVVSGDGYVVTNNHVVESADTIIVTFPDRSEYKATRIGVDRPSDIALLKIDAKNLPYLKLGDSSKLRLGEIVLAIGNPFGVGQTVTMGIVSAKGRANIGIVDYEDFIQTDASINPGNSGGALVNMNGELVGINTAILSKSGGAQGIGFAVPSKMVNPILDQIRKHGRVRRGYLGVSIKDLTAEIASSLKVEAVTGVVVADVKDDGPAHGKIEAYDVIVAVDGRPTETTGQLRNQIALTLPGSKATLTLFRAGKKRDVSLVLTEKDEDNAVASTSPKNQPIWAGLTVESLTQELRVRLKLNKNLRGVVVTGVEPGSAAERCGLEEGDIISGVNRDRVESKSDFDKAIDKKADHVTLRVFRRGGYDFVVLKN
jgi:serine protease Do